MFLRETWWLQDATSVSCLQSSSGEFGSFLFSTVLIVNPAKMDSLSTPAASF